METHAAADTGTPAGRSTLMFGAGVLKDAGAGPLPPAPPLPELPDPPEPALPPDDPALPVPPEPEPGTPPDLPAAARTVPTPEVPGGTVPDGSAVGETDGDGVPPDRVSR